VPNGTCCLFIFGAKQNIDLQLSLGRHMKSRRAGKKLVVVIDDDPLVLEATGGLLRSWGCNVVAAESCSDAVAQLTEIGQRPDLIVCDYQLPRGQAGPDAIETLRNAFEIPALLISGDASLPHAADGVGGYRLLRKPLSVECFRAVLVDASVLQSES
jgi:two-component system, sensor histidine kinase